MLTLGMVQSEVRCECVCRPQKLRGFWPRTKELLSCFLKQIFISVVNRDEYTIMESAFILTHGIRTRPKDPFTFLGYVRRAMEQDFSKICGLSIVLWIFIILFVLLSSAIGECRSALLDLL